MGTGEEGTPSKPSKQASTAPPAQELQTQQPTYNDWSSSMQAYYGAGVPPQPFYPSSVGSPAPHPYMWGAQHPMMPPYGTPVPYPAMYPPGGVYAHPGMVTTPASVAPTNPESKGKSADGKERASAKKTKGAAGTVGGKAGESGKATSGSGNDGGSQSGESGSEGSSDGSDENGNQDYGANKKGSFDKMLADGASAQNNTGSVPGKPVMPATGLNMGMDLWSASPAGTGTAKVRGNQSGTPSAVGDEHWIQDERELKRQKRKQSNRESARRSRLRKQAECEELQKSVQGLTNENHGLKDELQRLSQECEKLASENASIKEELTRLCGPDLVANIEEQSRGGEGNS